MVYLTFGDIYGGVFQSQVIDVLKHINKTRKKELKLISYVPYPIYKEQKKLIKSNYKHVSVLPMLPSRNHWIIAHSLLLVFSSLFTLINQRVVCRSIWSTNIALFLKKIKVFKWVCYDGRGAAYAEWKEYLITNTDVNIKNIYKAEKKAYPAVYTGLAYSTSQKV